ncbi:MAG: 4a-hydroxytetrahydrobiopterin dehydratase [Thermoplasmatota archaeon]|nr:4a-hydroxytetrahydrobiopterin dehydratase [Halobacteriales archaeon]
MCRGPCSDGRRGRTGRVAVLANRHRKDLTLQDHPRGVPLAQEACRELPKGSPSLGTDEAKRLAAEVPAWRVEGKRLVRELRFQDFKAAIAFVDAVARLAEAQQHHPDVHVTGYRNVRIEFSTHSVGGLSRNDFVMAAKADAVPGVPE